MMVAITDSPALAMPIILAFFFLVGTFLEPVPALIIIVPVMTPIIQHLGFHPVHFGIIAIMMLVYGSVTPPVGILAMVACRIAGIEYSRSFGMLCRTRSPGWRWCCWSPTCRRWRFSPR